jgi:hypothetical protein
MGVVAVPDGAGVEGTQAGALQAELLRCEASTSKLQCVRGRTRAGKQLAKYMLFKATT